MCPHFLPLPLSSSALLPLLSLSPIDGLILRLPDVTLEDSAPRGCSQVAEPGVAHLAEWGTHTSVLERRLCQPVQQDVVKAEIKA